MSATMGLLAYRAVISSRETDGVFVATFPDFPELSCEGPDPDRVRMEASSKLGSALRAFVSSGKQLPPASAGEGHMISVPHDIVAKLAVVAAFAATNLPTSDLARRLGIPEGQVRKILDPRQETDLGTLAAALGALGEQLAEQADEA
jgi:antitoxin HicB